MLEWIEKGSQGVYIDIQEKFGAESTNSVKTTSQRSNHRSVGREIVVGRHRLTETPKWRSSLD